jgi:two-component system response regulator AtoC
VYLTQNGNGNHKGTPVQGSRLAESATSPLNGVGSEAAGSEAATRDSWFLGQMVGRSLPMQHLFARMRCTAPYFRLATVEGESGTGKMLAAQTLHRIGPASAGPFAPFLAAEFLENAELLWKNNHRGLVYLARIDELAAEKQRMLRDFLARTAHERIRTPIVFGPLQLVAGTAQPLRRAAAAGAFRMDLASHLTAIRFAIPPLRERREDIALLAGIFLERWSQLHGKPLRGFAPGATENLSSYTWPGNVRELESAISAAALECTGQWIRPIDLPSLQWPGTVPAAPQFGAGPEERNDDPNLDRAILRHITRVLARTGGNKVRTARMLGISRSTLYRLLDPAALASQKAGGDDLGTPHPHDLLP